MSYLTDEEITELNASDLSRATAFAMRNVSSGFFSVARHYGGAKINGASYTYFPESDELIRDDVLQWITKRRKAQKRSRVEAARQPSTLFSETEP